MNRKSAFVLLLLAGTVAQADMAAMSNEDLESVSAQQGVAITLDWRLNSDKTGTPLSLCTNATTYTECRVAWSFNNRGTDDVDKKWLVLKGMTGALYIPYLRVDASTVTYTTDSATSKTIPAVLLSLGDTSAAASGANTKVQVKNLIIDNIAFEQDNGTRRGYFADSTTEPTGAAIPAGKNTGFMGLQINGPSNVANIQIDGTVKLFPCLGDHQSC